jgi:hypothetical protein
MSSTDHEYFGLSYDDIEDLRYHSTVYPHHGLNCSCMDQFIRKMRNHMKDIVGEYSDVPRFEYVLMKAVDTRARLASNNG